MDLYQVQYIPNFLTNEETPHLLSKFFAVEIFLDPSLEIDSNLEKRFFQIDLE